MPIWDPLVPVERGIQRFLARLPPSVSHWLGYRSKTLPPSRTWMVCLWGFIGAFCGLSTILAIFGHTDYFKSRAVPPIVASFVSHICYFVLYRLGFADTKQIIGLTTFGNRVLQQSFATVLLTFPSPSHALWYLVISSVALLASSSLQFSNLTSKLSPFRLFNGSPLRSQQLLRW